MTEILEIIVKNRDATGTGSARAIRRTSGGMGKKDDSEKARINKAGAP